MRACEISLYKAVSQPDGIENLRATIGLIGRDAHLGHHLQNPLADRLDETLLDFIGRDFILQILRHRPERFKREPWIDRFRAIACKTREVMHFPRLACFNHETHRRAQPLANQMMVDCSGSQQCRHRNPVRPNHAVRQNNNVVPAFDSRFRAFAQTLKHVMHAIGTLLGRIGNIERLGIKTIFEMADTANFFEVAIRQNRLAHFQPFAARIAFKIKNIRPWPDKRDEAHHELFADRINRWVRDLGEILLEICVKQLRLVRHR